MSSLQCTAIYLCRNVSLYRGYFYILPVIFIPTPHTGMHYSASTHHVCGCVSQTPVGRRHLVSQGLRAPLDVNLRPYYLLTDELTCKCSPGWSFFFATPQWPRTICSLQRLLSPLYSMISSLYGAEDLRPGCAISSGVNMSDPGGALSVLFCATTLGQAY